MQQVRYRCIDYFSTTAQCNILHLIKFTSLQYRNAVVGTEREVWLLKLNHNVDAVDYEQSLSTNSRNESSSASDPKHIMICVHILLSGIGR